MKKFKARELVAITTITIAVRVVISCKRREYSISFLLDNINKRFTLGEVKSILLPKLKVLGVDITYKMKPNCFRIVESAVDLKEDTLYRIENLDFVNNCCIITSC